MSDRELRTQFSMRALDLADTFKFSLGSVPVGVYHPELTAPDGPSTGGGVQSVQHICLVAPNRPSLVVGSANQVEHQVELRTFHHIDGGYRQRFGRTVDVDVFTYDLFLQRARDFFEQQGLNVQIPPAPAPTAPIVAPPQARSPWLLFIAGMLVASLVALTLVLLLRR